MEKSVVMQHLRKHINERLHTGENIGKKMQKLFDDIEKASENDVSFGNCPSYFVAYMECNSTGVATSQFEGSKTQRTVALDYTTDSYVFFDGDEGTAVKGLEIFCLKPGETVNCHPRSSMEKLAKLYGHQLHFQQFRDINMSMSSHRLNRYTPVVTKEPFTYPIRPIYIALEGRTELTVVGYAYEKDGMEYIIIDLAEKKEKKEKGVFSPWMLLGLIMPPMIIIIFFVVVYRLAKKSFE